MTKYVISDRLHPVAASATSGCGNSSIIGYDVGYFLRFVKQEKLHVRVEANLLPAQFLWQMLNLQNEGQVKKYSNRINHIRWQFSISIKVIPEHFLLVLTGFPDIHI